MSNKIVKVGRKIIGFIELIEDTEILLIFRVGNTSTQPVNISKVYISS